MRKKTVKITLLNNTEWYVPEKEFNTFNVPETPDAVISNYIRGSKGPLIRVNSLADMTGEYKLINANYIVEVDITYN